MTSTRPIPVHELSEEAALAHLRMLCPSGYCALRVISGTAANGRPLYAAEGYFDDLELAAKAAVAQSRLGYDGVYVVMQPFDSDCLSRSLNRFGGKGTAAVSSNDITGYRVLVLDFDPVRASGISATHEEMVAAIERAEQVQKDLNGLDWPDPLYALGSGNGAHLAYRVKSDASPQNVALYRDLLQALDAKYSDERVKVDTKMFNPARITKLAGTWARKGTSTVERPHRASWLIESNPGTTVVRVKQLRRIADVVDEAKKEKQGEVRMPRTVDELVKACTEHGLDPKLKPEWKTEKDGTPVPLIDVKCWREQHGNRAGYVVVRGDNKIVAKCQHESCDANTMNFIEFMGWKDEISKFCPDDERRIWEMMNETGLTQVELDDAIVWFRAKPGFPVRRWKTQQAVRSVYDTYPRLKGDDGYEQHPFAVWSRSENRREADGVEYDPEHPLGAILRRKLNLWAGLPYTPARSPRGDALVEAYRESLHENICAGNKELSIYLWKLFAWKVQHPTRLPWVFIILTGDQGSGKNQLVLPLVNLFGEHGLHTSKPLTAQQFNSQMEGKAIVYHDDAEFLGSPQVMRILRPFITESAITYESKGVDRYQGRNLALHIAASNNPKVHIDPTDRRILLIPTRAPEGKEKWFQSRGLHDLIGKDFLDRPESIAYHAALLHALQNEKLSRFSPAPPPQTHARSRQISDHLSPLEEWVLTALTLGRIPGLCAAGSTREQGSAEVEWQEGRELWAEDRKLMWVTFRTWIESLKLRQTATGQGSVHGFQIAVGRLLGVESEPRKRSGKPDRRWVLPSLTVVRANFARALGVKEADEIFNA